MSIHYTIIVENEQNQKLVSIHIVEWIKIKLNEKINIRTIFIDLKVHVIIFKEQITSHPTWIIFDGKTELKMCKSNMHFFMEKVIFHEILK